jgi:hypothetical protein
VLEGNEVSKFHCTIYFNKSIKKWIVMDGCEEKLSFNGVWQFIFDSIQLSRLKKNMFKYGKSVFSIKYEDNK